MTNAELIKALKDAEGYMIYVAPNCYASCEAIKAIRAAAYALKAADAKIVKLNTKCADLQSQIYEMENEIEELMPKEGEWINPSRNPDIVNKDFFSDCSVCGETFMDESNYCPNCGAKMKGANDADN